jgi:predicted dehydrogenase
MKRVQDGAIGKIVAARCFWNQGGLWMNKRQQQWSDVEWQMRNWLYFTWLSGDHICEQHVHNLDVMNWGLGATPIKCTAMGGRQVRTDPAYGQIFDHFAVDFEYPGMEKQRGGAPIYALSMCRQIEGCASGVSEQFTGTEGTCSVWPNGGEIKSARSGASWKFSGPDPDPYTEEHRFLIGAIQSGKPVNEGVRIAESTLTAIMGRMSAYTGKSVTWEQAMSSKLNLLPSEGLQLGPMETPPIAVPGKTALV